MSTPTSPSRSPRQASPTSCCPACIASRRWCSAGCCTHQGAVKPEHLQAYLDEFAFRFNRRRSRARGMLFYRLLEHSVQAPPRTLSLARHRSRLRPRRPAATTAPQARPTCQPRRRAPRSPVAPPVKPAKPINPHRLHRDGGPICPIRFASRSWASRLRSATRSNLSDHAIAANPYRGHATRARFRCNGCHVERAAASAAIRPMPPGGLGWDAFVVLTRGEGVP
jgi:hypothetical protein